VADLLGKTLLLPRDPDRALPYVQALEAAGARVMVEPVTRIEPGSAAELAAAFATLAAGDFAWLVAASGEVAKILPAVPTTGGARVAAIGSATAAALTARGWPIDLVATGTGAAALAQALRPHVLAGSRVLLPRAAGGRPELGVALRAGGAEVTEVVAYRTVARHPDELVPLVRALTAGAIDGVVFFAPSQVAALEAAFPAADFTRVLGGLALRAAIGPTTAAAMAAAGTPAHVIAGSPTVASLLEALGHG
jgi:uroporphyrinogen-III synthase